MFLILRITLPMVMVRLAHHSHWGQRYAQLGRYCDLSHGCIPQTKEVTLRIFGLSKSLLDKTLFRILIIANTQIDCIPFQVLCWQVVSLCQTIR